MSWNAFWFIFSILSYPMTCLFRSKFSFSYPLFLEIPSLSPQTGRSFFLLITSPPPSSLCPPRHPHPDIWLLSSSSDLPSCRVSRLHSPSRPEQPHPSTHHFSSCSDPATFTLQERQLFGGEEPVDWLGASLPRHYQQCRREGTYWERRHTFPLWWTGVCLRLG